MILKVSRAAPLVGTMGGLIALSSIVGAFRPAAARVVLSGAQSSTSCLGSEALRTSAEIDVFLIAGQSNATGFSTNREASPPVPHGKVLQYYENRISDANDPVGNANKGSAWPAFGATYHELTGHTVMLVPASVPASPIAISAAMFPTGYWDRGGLLLEIAMAKADGAMLCAGSSAHFRGVLWDQGEEDALAINSNKETGAQYRSLFSSVIARVRAHFGRDTPFFIFETGTVTTGPQKGYAEVRAAEEITSKTLSDAPIVFNKALTFPARGLMEKDATHYTQAGYNEMGRSGALAVASYLSRHRTRTADLPYPERTRGEHVRRAGEGRPT